MFSIPNLVPDDCVLKFQTVTYRRGALGGSEYRNTAKKNSANTAIPQFFNSKWKRDVIPKPLLCKLKLRANKTEITIKNLLMIVKSSDKISNIHWCGWLIINKK